MSTGMTRKELASLAGYTYRRLYDIDRTLPEDKKLFVQSKKAEGDKAERCDAALFVQRWVDYCVENAQGARSDLDKAKAEHEVLKKRKTELEVEKMEGATVPLEDVKREWEEICREIMQGMMALPGRLAGRLVMMESAEQIGAIIEEDIRRVLLALSEDRTQAQDAGEEDEA